ncbi:MAG: 3-isopropylmalate dehydratase [Ignavibacteria bacterium]|nr:3-isopropylmalate dehydratase [Ignavibacteria bacterium]
MDNLITGKIYVLGNNIDTDQIIPAEHLVYSTSDPEEAKKYGHFALSSVPPEEAGLPHGNLPFIHGDNYQSEYSIIIGGSNFGCGSSREHAPFALQVAGVKVVVAESYARIFYRNSVDGGFLVPMESAERLCDILQTGESVTIDITNGTITRHYDNRVFTLKNLGSVFAIVQSGGLFQYARQNQLL